MSVQTQNAAPATLPSGTTIATEFVANEHRQIVVVVPSQTPIVRTTTRSRPTTSGTIAAGARAITVVNIGSSAGALDGMPLEAKAGFDYPVLAVGEHYEAISFDASGTQFDILEVR